MSQETECLPHLKEDTGCLPFPIPCLRHGENCPPFCNTFEDNEKLVEQLDSNIGRYSWQARNLFDAPPSSAFSRLGENAMQNSLGQDMQMNTFGKKKPAYLDLNLNWEHEPLNATLLQTGLSYEPPQSLETLNQSMPTYLFAIMGISVEYIQIMLDLLPLFDLVKPLSELLEQEKVNLPGKKLAKQLTLKIQQRSGGTATKVKNMLSLMSFAETSTSAISLDGSTVILSIWKSKGRRSLSRQQNFGFAPTLLPENGTP